VTPEQWQFAGVVIAAVLGLIGVLAAAYFAYRAAVRSKPTSNGFAGKVLGDLAHIREKQGYISGRVDEHITESARRHEATARAAASAVEVARAAHKEAMALRRQLEHWQTKDRTAADGMRASLTEVLGVPPINDNREGATHADTGGD
jgi:hypothetical protein